MCVLMCVCVRARSLQIIKDFYLLGRGELYQVFIDLAQQMLKTLPTAVTEHGQCGRSLGTVVVTGICSISTACADLVERRWPDSMTVVCGSQFVE